MVYVIKTPATVSTGSRRCAVALLTGLAAAFFARALRAEEPKPADVVTAITKPSKALKLAFAAPGVVMDVPVVEGQVVKKGDLLAQQDDRQDQASLESMKLDAASTAEIDYSVTDRGVQVVKQKRYEDMVTHHVAAQSELEDARLKVQLGDAQIDLAKLKHQQKQLDAAKQQFKVDEEKLLSPIDGVVQKLNVGPGEMADPQNREGAIVVVKNDPLWAEMHLATQQALQLKMGQPLQVQYAGQSDWKPAKVIFLDPQADAASDTQLVRLELPNPSGAPSGLQVQVKLPGSAVASRE